MTSSQLNTILTLGLSGAASLYSLSDLAMLDRIHFLGNKSNYMIHFELAAVMSVVSGLAVSKLIWPERRKSEPDSGPETHEMLPRVSISCEKPEYVPVNGLDFALK